MEGGAVSVSSGVQAEEEHVASAAAGVVRSEIDTSVPFASVKEAVDHFGGSAEWNLQLKQIFNAEKQHCPRDAELVKVEEHTAQLKKNLATKERETLNVLNELKTTKKTVNDLTLSLQEETVKAVKMSVVSANIKVHPMVAFQEDAPAHPMELDADGLGRERNLSKGLAIMELKQAKVNLSSATRNYTDIQASTELFKSQIQEEKYMLEKIREKLASDAAVVTSLLEDLIQTTQKHQKIQYLENKRFEDSVCISQKIMQRSHEIENFKKVSEAAKIEVSRLMSDIEETKANMKIDEIRIVAAKKMEASARAVESVALLGIKALTESASSDLDPKNSSEVILSMEEYTTLMSKAREAEVTSINKIRSVIEEVDEANQSKAELLTKVEEANAVAKIWKKALENALERADTANRGKLVVEEALRKLRIENGKKRRITLNSTEVKGYSTHHRSSHVLDLNSSSLTTESPNTCLDPHPPLSIGQMISTRLMDPEEYSVNLCGKDTRKPVCLRQILSTKGGVSSPLHSKDGNTRKETFSKRTKLRLASLSLLLSKQHKKNKEMMQPLNSK